MRKSWGIGAVTLAALVGAAGAAQGAEGAEGAGAAEGAEDAEVRLESSAGAAAEAVRMPEIVVRGRAEDLAMTTNRPWLEKMNRIPVLATTPLCEPTLVRPEKGLIPEAILEAVAQTYWPDVLGGGDEGAGAPGGDGGDGGTGGG